MADITIVGLGPGPVELRTVAVQQALDSAERIFVRMHPDLILDELAALPNVTDLEPYHDMSELGGQRWMKAALAVCDAAANTPVVLAIPGHPRFGEGLTRDTIREANTRGLTTKVLDGISVTDLMASSLDLDPIADRIQLLVGRSLISLDEQAPFDGGSLNITPRLPLFITHVYDNTIMRAISTQLRRIFPPEHSVELIDHAGSEQQSLQHLSLSELAEHPGGPMLAVYVPPMGELDATRTPATLQHIVARLRREDGCPWDRKQTNQTLAAPLVDEVYEAIDAINADDDANLAEELGDLLLLIMMHAQIAEERGAFRLEDVYHGIATKIVRRHPHVFGDDAAQNADDVVGLWQRVKQEEKAERPGKPEKAADGQPHSMPALERATRVLKKHPVDAVDVANSTPESRQQALLDAVASVVAAGNDPNEILKQALENHVSGIEAGTKPGEESVTNLAADQSGVKNASR